MHSPCLQCYVRGHLYDPEDSLCSGCEYRVAIHLLKKILTQNDGCKFCTKQGDNCDLNQSCSEFVIDWERAWNEF